MWLNANRFVLALMDLASRLRNWSVVSHWNWTTGNRFVFSTDASNRAGMSSYNQNYSVILWISLYLDRSLIAQLIVKSVKTWIIRYETAFTSLLLLIHVLELWSVVLANVVIIKATSWNSVHYRWVIVTFIFIYCTGISIMFRSGIYQFIKKNWNVKNWASFNDCYVNLTPGSRHHVVQ